MPDACLLILLDGLGDRAHARLGHRTPLQAADTPFLDRLASLGATGLYHATRFGQPLPSENAHFAIFGGAPGEFPGRGPLEALGAGVDLGPDDVAVLSHFAHVKADADGRLFLARDKVRMEPDECRALFDAIPPFERDGIRITLHPVGGLFGVLRLTGPVSPHVTDTNPMVDGRPIPALLPLREHEHDPAAQGTAGALRAFLIDAYHRLREAPVNRARLAEKLAPATGLVTQRAGRLTDCPPFRERYGLRGLSIAGGAMYAGLARFTGMDFHRATDTGDPGGDMAERVRLALKKTSEYDFIHVHTKTPDQAAHTKDPAAKVQVIESLDRGLASALEPLDPDASPLLVVTADHSTPSCGPLIHSGEPVPLMIVGDGVRRDRVDAFDEISAAGGCLGCMRGRELLLTILNHLDKARLEGIRDCPAPVEYWPGDHLPFTLDPDPKP
ncbi:MAG: 2,3-bisphosphoglycerate-independent phosphoglycerate mutase [Desulfovibrionaceae bacterium]|nr:2,3-bisphosphoglycerate-independent phosphoglycerate mutase [Desulfovibrionaceae bacterium]